MTGHGDASDQNERISVNAEVRSVNNRHLKVTVRCSDSDAALDSKIEKLVRDRIARGSVSVNVNIRSLENATKNRLNEAAIQQYWSQLKQLADSLDAPRPTDISTILSLPGVLSDDVQHGWSDADWPLIASVVDGALTRFEEFRDQEGAAMADELLSLGNAITRNLDLIAERAPNVVTDHRDRLLTRVNEMLEKASVKLNDNDLIREVSLFSDRCDITEEITRLRSHLQQYQTHLDNSGELGRSLDFLGQEMFREINTIGSKANDVEIAHRVVDVKASIEKMREIIQNIE